jgi:predicted phage gp36 major capsid-like protein
MRPNNPTQYYFQTAIQNTCRINNNTTIYICDHSFKTHFKAVTRADKSRRLRFACAHAFRATAWFVANDKTFHFISLLN